MPQGVSIVLECRTSAASTSGSEHCTASATCVASLKVTDAPGRDDQGLYHASTVSLLGQLAASIIHELRQPLSSVMMNAEVAEQLLDRESVGLVELRQVCREIAADNRRATEIIRKLSSLYRRGECQREPIDLNVLVGDTISLASGDLERRDVAVVMHFATPLPVVPGDRVHLQQLLLNLIINAADSMSELEVAGREMTIATASHADVVTLRVVDRGKGVPVEARERIFEPFWSTRPGGMGMGLAICRSIVSAHGGTLTVLSAVDGGAEFRVSLPTQAPSSSRCGAPCSAGGSDGAALGHT